MIEKDAFPSFEATLSRRALLRRAGGAGVAILGGTLSSAGTGASVRLH
jgi:hypothetical protein